MSKDNPYQGYHAQLLEKLERLERENAALREQKESLIRQRNDASKLYFTAQQVEIPALLRENAALRSDLNKCNNLSEIRRDAFHDEKSARWAMVDRVRELERENAALRELTSTLGAPNHINVPVEQWRELRADKERLDWMEKARPIAWALGSADRGEYWLLTDIGEKHPEEAEEFATLRAAIDAARKEAQP